MYWSRCWENLFLIFFAFTLTSGAWALDRQKFLSTTLEDLEKYGSPAKQLGGKRMLRIDLFFSKAVLSARPTGLRLGVDDRMTVDVPMDLLPMGESSRWRSYFVSGLEGGRKIVSIELVFDDGRSPSRADADFLLNSEFEKTQYIVDFVYESRMLAHKSLTLKEALRRVD